MFVIELNPVAVAVLIALLVEIIVSPLFDFTAEKLSALSNRFTLFHHGKGTLGFDRSVVAPTAGIFLSRRHLCVSSLLKKILIFGFIVGELFLDTEPEDQLEEVSGVMLQRLDTFRDIVQWEKISEHVVRELSYIRRACEKSGTFYETAFVGNDILCGEVALFSVSFDEPGTENYNMGMPCAIGNLADDRMVCEGNRITFPCSSRDFEARTDGGCIMFKMFELLNETTLRYANIDSEGAVFGDVVKVNFRNPVTTDLISNMTYSHRFEVPLDFTLLTASIVDDPFDDPGQPPTRMINAFTRVSFHTRVTRTAVICFSVVFAIFLLFLLLVALAYFASRHASETKTINPVNTAQNIALLAAASEIRKKTSFQALLHHSNNGPVVNLRIVGASESSRIGA